MLFYISKLVGTIVQGPWDNVLGRPSPSHFAGTLSHTITVDGYTKIGDLGISKSATESTDDNGDYTWIQKFFTA